MRLGHAITIGFAALLLIPDAIGALAWGIIHHATDHAGPSRGSA